MKLFPVTIPRKEPFRIAKGTSTAADNVVVKLTAGDTVGWGAACPSTVVFGESMDGTLRDLETLKRRVVGAELKDLPALETHLEEAAPEAATARAGISIAAHDLAAKAEGIPLHQFLGGHLDRIITSKSIGIGSLQETVEAATRWIREGFVAIKLKVGLDLENDIAMVAAVREAVGPEILLWVDANQGYSLAEATSFAEAAAELEVAFFEQPLPADDLKGMRELSRMELVPVMVDETVLTAADMRRVIDERAADVVNIKLMKSGGIAEAIRIASAAGDAHMRAVVGCRSETTLSITAGLHVALSQRPVVYADLDSQFNLEWDVAGGLTFSDGFLRPSDGPGLGLEVDEDRLT
jgi:L-alanine-DL-glutamate epimerase-like enolase superfamily enzyme